MLLTFLPLWYHWITQLAFSYFAWYTGITHTNTGENGHQKSRSFANISRLWHASPCICSWLRHVYFEKIYWKCCILGGNYDSASQVELSTLLFCQLITHTTSGVVCLNDKSITPLRHSHYCILLNVTKYDHLFPVVPRYRNIWQETGETCII